MKKSVFRTHPAWIIGALLFSLSASSACAGMSPLEALKETFRQMVGSYGPAPATRGGGFGFSGLGKRSPFGGKGSLLPDAEDWTTPEMIRKFEQELPVGRRAELDMMISRLDDPTNKNGLLVGKTGSGKTNLMKAFAIQVKKRGGRLLVLRGGSFISDAGLLGDFEGRITGTFKELEELNQKQETILFVDEFHTFIGSGKGGAQRERVSAGELVKDYLLTGKAPLWGAFTPEDLAVFVEGNAALERRMRLIFLSELGGADLFEALMERADKELSKQYGVHFTVGAVIEALNQGRHLPNQGSPSRELDILTAAAQAKNREPSREIAQIERLERTLRSLQREQQSVLIFGGEYESYLMPRLVAEVAQIEKKLQRLRRVSARKIELAEQLKKMSRQPLQGPSVDPALVKQLEQMHGEYATLNGGDVWGWVSAATVRLSQLPLSSDDTFEHLDIKDVAPIIAQGVIGQDLAVQQIVAGFEAANSILMPTPKGPRAVYGWAGPDSFARQQLIANANNLYFRGANPPLVINVDTQTGLSLEQLQGHTLIRAPGLLTGEIKVNGQRLIVFENVDRAAPDVLALIEKIVKDGELLGPNNERISFHGSVVILSFAMKALALPRGAFHPETFVTDVLKALAENRPQKATLVGDLVQPLDTAKIRSLLQDATMVPIQSPSQQALEEHFAQQCMATLNARLRANEVGLLLTINSNDVSKFVARFADSTDGAGLVKAFQAEVIAPLDAALRTRTAPMGVLSIGTDDDGNLKLPLKGQCNTFTPPQTPQTPKED